MIGHTVFQVSRRLLPCVFNAAVLNRLPELSTEQRAALESSKRISNPGCYPTGFIGLTRPLVDAGIILPGTPLTVNAISGYSGGGKSLMGVFENEDHEPWGAYAFALVSRDP